MLTWRPIIKVSMDLVGSWTSCFGLRPGCINYVSYMWRLILSGCEKVKDGVVANHASFSLVLPEVSRLESGYRPFFSDCSRAWVPQKRLTQSKCVGEGWGVIRPGAKWMQ